MSSLSQGAPPIFLLGIGPRSGSHYLHDLFIQHPDCRPATRTGYEFSAWEDHLLRHAMDLRDYVDRVDRSSLDVIPEGRSRLWACIGLGLSEFLRTLDSDDGSVPDERPVVTVTPQTDQVELFRSLFPHSPVIFIVRNPAAMLVSSVRTFGGRPEVWLERWKRSARRTLDFLASDSGPSTVVRYEDLLTDLKGALTPALLAASLAPDSYPFETADALPVRGSSRSADQGGAVHWRPVARRGDFDGLSRGQDVTGNRFRRLSWVTEPEASELGYPGDGSGELAPLETAYQRAQDAFWASARLSLDVSRWLRRPLASARREPMSARNPR